MAKIEIAGMNAMQSRRRLLIFRPGDRISVKAVKPPRMMFLGGDALEGPRHIWWNFVSSSKERIEQAKQDWKSRPLRRTFRTSTSSFHCRSETYSLFPLRHSRACAE